MKVLIAVTHLLGTGHLARALVLARAFAQAGHGVTVASGGMPVAHLDHGGVDVIQLPPLRSDGVNFTRLLDIDGAPASDRLLRHRVEMLRDCLARTRPDVVITELFPFGRRVLGDEFGALLDTACAARPRPVICASIRDILAPPSKPAKARATAQLVAAYYDAVLVHSDPDIVALDASWPVTPELEARLRYTGFVAPAPAGPHPDSLGQGEVLVTTGGGDVGARLFQVALAAAAQQPAQRWRLLVGGAASASRIADLRAKAPGNALVAPATPAFRAMLYHAAASVSFCGYNTALDVLQAGTPAVFVPFDDGGEVEQTLRARSLARHPGVEVLTSDRLSPENLLACLAAAISAPRRPEGMLAADGAVRMVAIVTELAAGRAG